MYSENSLVNRCFFYPILLALILVTGEPCAQVAGFVAPDTVCTGEQITITNTTAGGSTWYWNFCSGNASENPSGVNIGNPGNLLDIPTYITLVKHGSDCFSFVSCQGVGVIRYHHGASFKNNPVSWTNLGTFGGTITFNQEGIQVKEDNGQWYGFVCSDTKLVRLNFSNSPGNTPTATSLPFSGLNTLHGLVIIKEGNIWLGFATCSTGNKMVRFNFGTSLANVPVMTDFGNFAGFTSPGAICLVQENSSWYGLVMAGGNTISRITFGNSLLNTPTGVNLGNPGGFNSAIGLTLLRDCESTVGYYTNYISPGQLGKLNFPNGITGSLTGQLLGNIGSLDKPHSFSELFRQNDTLYAYITNRQNGTLTRLTFPPCTNASVPSSTLFNPPSFSYNTPGTYNIRLIVNEGLPTQSSLCKSIVVLPAPCNTIATFTAPDTVCTGEPVSITNQSTTGANYYWSFCSGNALSNPVGQNIGNPGNLLNIPGYITLVKDGGTCYSFITAQGTESVIRYNHGASFSNNPVSWTNLGGFGLLADTVLGIKICNDNGLWIGIVNNNNRLVRLNFGTSLANTPTATLLGPYAVLNTAHCLDIFREGTTWVGYITCSWGNKLVRLNFGTSLLNAPVLTDLGTPGSLNMPGPFRFVSENGSWYALVVNLGNNTMTRLTFGNSLLNTPTGVNLGNPCPGITSGGITLIRDCEGTTGFQMNYSSSSPNLMWRLTFPNGITGSVTGTSLGNIGGLSRPSQFSELFRVGDTLFVYNTNRDNFTLTRHRFLPCTNASVSSSTLYNPPSFTYNQPGTYNIQLIMNEGLPTQASVCKSIVVLAAPCTATASFNAPDTVCVGAPVTLTNTSVAGTNFYWNFCSGSAGSTPTGTNIGNPGSNLVHPVYITLVKDGADCISFITNHGSPNHITWNYHGSSFRNNPLSTQSMLTYGILDLYAEGIQIKKDNGTWYGFVNNNTTVLRLNFGASLWNLSPVVTDLGPFPNITIAHGLVILKEGNTWLGFFDSDTQHKLYRLNFGTSLANTPVFTDLGNLAGFSHPCQIAAVKENGSCYLMVVNLDNNSLSRVNFGTSYLNTPAGQNLGNCGAMTSPVGLTLLNDCETSTGYYTIYKPSATAGIGRLSFSGGAGGTVTAQTLGNIGSLDYPHSFSELFRENDSLFAYVTNWNTSTLTRFSFPPCSNASIPSSTLFSPPPFSYNLPGTYAVRLVVNEGLFSEATICKSITVMAQPVVNLGNDRAICPGTTTTLDAGAGFTSYLWSTGATTRMITVGTAGSYWAKVTKYGCIDYDTVAVSIYPVTPVNLGPDQTVCEGQSVTFNAGACNGCSYVWSNLSTGQLNIGTGVTFTTGIPGIYSVLVTGTAGCISRDTVQLSSNPTPALTTWPLTQPVCSGNPVVISLSASVPGSNFIWTVSVSSPSVTGCFPGFGPVISQSPLSSSPVAQTATYHITPFIGSCSGPEVDYTVTINPSPSLLNAGITAEMCSSSFTGFALQSNVPGTQFSWTSAGSSPDVTGYSPGNGDSIIQQLFNSGFSNPLVTYTVTPAALGCNGAPGNYTMTIHPIPDVTFSPLSTTLCSGVGLNVQLLSQAQPAAYSWGVLGNSPYITNYFAGTGQTIQQTPLNQGPEPGTVTYTVTPESFGCQGMPVTYPVILNPIPELVVSPHPAEVCSGDAFALVFSSPTTGTSFTWSASAASSLVSGFSDGSGSSFIHVLENTGSTAETVTYTVTPAANECAGPTGMIEVSVKPKPDISFSPATQSVCWGQQAQITVSSYFPGASCSWSAAGSSPAVTGYSGGNGNFISQALYTSGFTTQLVTYSISSALAGCTSLVATAKVLTYPVPDMTITPAEQTICSGQHTGISLQSQLSGTSFQWTASGSPSVTGFTPGNGNTIIQLLANSANTTGWATYAITPQVSACQGMTTPVTVHVKPKPEVSLSLCTDTITTTGARPFLLRGGLPRGGTWAGPGVEPATGMFNPSVPGAGIHSVNYAYTNFYGCSDTLEGRIRVVQEPAFSCGGLLYDVRDGRHYGTFLLPNGKCWMQENLDFGTAIPESSPQADNCIAEKYTRLSSLVPPPSFYQWDELMDFEQLPGAKGHCPPGWHIPTSSEWEELCISLDGPGQAGGPLKDPWLPNGFHSLQQGFLYQNGPWAFTSGTYAGSMYWTSTPSGNERAVARGMNTYLHSVSRYDALRSNAFPARCVKD